MTWTWLLRQVPIYDFALTRGCPSWSRRYAGQRCLATRAGVIYDPARYGTDAQEKLRALTLQPFSLDKRKDPPPDPSGKHAGRGSGMHHDLSKTDVKLLHSFSFSAKDVDHWRELVDGPLFSSKSPHVFTKRIPLFVILEITSRTELNHNGLRSILTYLEDHSLCSGEPSSEDLINWKAPSAGASRVMSERALVIFQIFANLVKVAHECAPGSLEALAEAFVKWLCHMKPGDGTGRRSADQLAAIEGQALTWSANTFLQELGVGVAIQPFQTLPLQKAAQTIVLRHMVGNPVQIELNRSGYQALIRTQLMEPKTEQERAWANLKSLSWPPFKEDKTGMDARIDFTQGLSAAGQTMNMGQAAGYPLGRWEEAAWIYAGWDVDKTPTIQTRQYLGQVQGWQKDPNLDWTARIRTTRTLREAWAAFTAYVDAKKAYHQNVCQAMLEKILAAEHQRHPRPSNHDGVGTDYEIPEALPGDGLERSAPPPSIHQEVYTRSEPPSLSLFVKMMRSNNIQLKDSAIAHLLRRSNGWKDGRAILGVSAFYESMKEKQGNRPRTVLGATLALFRNDPSSALTRSMLRLSLMLPAPSKGRIMRLDKDWLQIRPLDQGRVLDRHVKGGWALNQHSLGFWVRKASFDHQTRVWGKWEILRAMANQRGLTPHREDSPLWDASLGLVDLGDKYEKLRQFKPQIDRMACLQAAIHVGWDDDLNMTDLRSMLKITSAAVQAALATQEKLLGEGMIGAGTESSQWATDLHRDAEATLDWAKTNVRRMFFDTVSPTDKSLDGDKVTDKPAAAASDDLSDATSDEPISYPESAAAEPDPVPAEGSGSETSCRLRHVPDPYTLHRVATALGTANDLPGLVELLVFMRTYWPEMRRHAMGDKSALRTVHRTLLEVKVGLHVGRRRAVPGAGAEEVALAFDATCGGAVQRAAPRAVYRQAVGIVRSMRREWGLWRSDAETRLYILGLA